MLKEGTDPEEVLLECVTQLRLMEETTTFPLSTRSGKGKTVLTVISFNLNLIACSAKGLLLVKCNYVESLMRASRKVKGGTVLHVSCDRYLLNSS